MKLREYFLNTKWAYIVWCSAFFLVASCGGKKKPAFPISEQQIYKVFADIQIAEAVWDNETQTMKDSLAKLYYPQIFEHNGITAKDFDSTMHLLSDDPVLMHNVYQEVIKEIQKHQPDKNPSNSSADSTNKPK